MTRPRRPRRPTSARPVPRTARLNELLRQIVAEELERIDDERLELVTITNVDVDRGSTVPSSCSTRCRGRRRRPHP
jgi:ribosome-binding factor A